MPPKTWTEKRERQYVHIKESLLSQGKAKPLAEEIAARVVNKERARHGESHGLDLKQAAIEAGGVSTGEFDAWVGEGTNR